MTTVLCHVIYSCQLVEQILPLASHLQEFDFTGLEKLSISCFLENQITLHHCFNNGQSLMEQFSRVKWKVSLID